MNRQKINNGRKLFLTLTMVLMAFAGAAFADDIRIDMEGSTATIPKGNTVRRNLKRIPKGIPGQIRLKLKWHAINVLPTFNRLKIQLRRGNRILRTRTCHSVHSNKSNGEKCLINFDVSETEASKNGFWNLSITNNSNYEVNGFDVEKGSDINPFVPTFKSVYRPNCPRTKNLDMEGGTLTLNKGNTQTRRIFLISKAPGRLKLLAKWHAVSLIPNYSRLRIQLLRPNGSVAKTGNYYSAHAPSRLSPQFNISYDISTSEATQEGSWSLRITNNSNFEVKGFDIAKGSDLLVKNFKSTYKATCGF